MASNKATLAALFSQGDIPQGTDYNNLIQSEANLAETVEQDMAGPLSTTKLIASRVSATNANFTGTVSAASFSLGSLNISGNVSANSINIATDVSAVTGTVYASAMRSTNGLFSGAGIVSAAGTSQATAAQLTFVVNRGTGVVDGSTTGYAIPANRTGLVQYLYNNGPSANLWPPTGGFINGLPANGAFALAASAMATIVHLAVSAYGVK